MQVVAVQSLIVVGEQVVDVGGQKLGQWCDLDVLAVWLQQPTVVVKFP